MYYYIVNPAAGGSLINSIQDRLKATLHQLKIDGEFAKTLGPGDAAKITTTALEKGAKTIVAVGGGETVNEVIAAVHRARRPEVAIGIIPTGKRNWLAQYLGIGGWREACEILAARRIMEYNLMSVNDEVFIQFLNLAVHQPKDEEEAEPKWWQKLITRRTPVQPISYKIEVDGAYKLRGEANTITVHNQKFLEPSLNNQLVVRIYETPGNKNWLGRFRGLVSRGQESNFSQIHSRNLKLRAQRLSEAVLDGKSITGKEFVIALTDQQLRLIAKSQRVTG